MTKDDKEIEGFMDLMEEEYCEVMDDFGCQALEAKNDDNNSSELQEEPTISKWIRVEANVDSTIESFKTRSQVREKIKQVIGEQSKHGLATPYDRKWQRNSVHSNHNNDSSRQGGSSSGSDFITILQFNTLAEGLSAGLDVQTAFAVPPEQRDTRGFGGFTSIAVPSVTLDFKLRRWRILDILLGGGIRTYEGTDDELPFDILALEEVDRYRGFFAPLLKIFGYQGMFMPKSQAPGVKMGFYSDGNALFWRSAIFDLLEEKRGGYRVGNQVYTLVALRHKESHRCILVAMTHLKAQKSDQNELLRCTQVDELICEVEIMKQNLVKQGENVTVCLMGDFNADRPQDISSESSVQRVLNFTAYDGSTLRSAYDLKEAEFYTTWKTRGDTTVKRVIDYIFHSSDASCVETLAVPRGEEMEEAKLPGLRYPSDHMMIAAKISFN